MQFSPFFKTKAKQGKINVCFNFTLLIYIVNLNAREILVTKMATKPQFLVTKEKMLVALVTISVIVSSHACSMEVIGLFQHASKKGNITFTDQ